MHILKHFGLMFVISALLFDHIEIFNVPIEEAIVACR